MSTKKITQREAAWLRKRIQELEVKENDRRKQWVKEYPDGTHIGYVSGIDSAIAKVKTARLLGHAVVVTEYNNELHFYALPIASEVSA